MIAEAAGFAIFLTLASGWGRLVPSRWWAEPRRSAVPGSYFVGFLLFIALFAIGAEFRMAFSVAIGATVGFISVGTVGLVRTLFGDWRAVVPHVLIGFGMAAFWVLGASIAGNEGAADPHFYAVSPFVLFRSDWVARNVPGLPDSAPILST